MPNIKQYTRQVLPNELINVQASASSFGAEAAAGQMEIAKAMEGLGDTVKEIEKKRQTSQYIEDLSRIKIENLSRREELSKMEFEDESQIAQQYQADLEQRLSSYKPPAFLRDRYQQDLANMKLEFTGYGISEQTQRAAKRAETNFQNSLDNINNMVARSPSRAAEGIEMIRELTASMPLDPAEKEALLDGAQDGIKFSAAQSVAENSPSSFMANYNAGKYDDIPNAPRLKKIADAKIKSFQSKAKSKIKDELDAIGRLQSNGVRVTDDEFDLLRDKAAGIGLSETVDSIDFMKEVNSEINHFVNDLTVDGQREFLQEKFSEMESERDDQSIKKFNYFKKMFNHNVKRLNSDALSFYEETDVVPAYNQLDFSSPENLALELSNRKASTEIIKARDGINVPVLKQGEVKQIAALLENSQPKEQAALVSNINASIRSVYGDDALNVTRSLAQQISKDAPMAAVAMNLPQDDAAKLFSGDRTKGEVEYSKLRKAVNRKIAGAIFEAENLEGIHSSVHAMYKHLALAEGDVNKEPTDALVDKAIEKVVGKKVEIFGGNAFSFKDDSGEYLSSSRLQNVLERLTDQNIPQMTTGSPTSQDGLEITADEILSKGKFVSSSEGTYKVMINGGYLKNRNGGWFIIDARKLNNVQPTNKIREAEAEFLSIREGF